MAKPLPVGFPNWRAFFFPNIAVANNLYVKASFVESDGTNWRAYRGPTIASITAASSAVVTTAEAHGFHVGQTIRINGLPNALSAINTTHVITAVGSSTTFTIAASTTGLSSVVGAAIVGVDMGLTLLAASFGVVPGALCVDDYPGAHELPWEG